MTHQLDTDIITDIHCFIVWMTRQNDLTKTAVVSAQFFAGESAIKKKPKYVINPQSNRYAYWQLLTTVALGFAAR